MGLYTGVGGSGSFSPSANPGYNPQYSQGWSGSGKNAVGYTPGQLPPPPNYGVRSRQNWGMNPNPPTPPSPGQLGNLPYAGNNVQQTQPAPQQQPISGLGQQTIPQQQPISGLGRVGQIGGGPAPVSGLGNAGPIGGPAPVSGLGRVGQIGTGQLITPPRGGATPPQSFGGKSGMFGPSGTGKSAVSAGMVSPFIDPFASTDDVQAYGNTTMGR
jgi:hypothetical protein